MRNVGFKHKHEDFASVKYVDSMKKFNLENIEKISDEFFGLISDVSLAHKQSSYAKSEFSYKGEISDYIDLILLGSIHAAVYRVNEKGNKLDFYWQSRERFYRSDQILEVLVDDLQMPHQAKIT